AARVRPSDVPANGHRHLARHTAFWNQRGGGVCLDWGLGILLGLPQTGICKLLYVSLSLCPILTEFPFFCCILQNGTVLSLWENFGKLLCIYRKMNRCGGRAGGESKFRGASETMYIFWSGDVMRQDEIMTWMFLFFFFFFFFFESKTGQ
ncbi:hypothetical protein COCVIDRAFT_93239, partial [Bipolaris victoriae FI3]